MAFSHESQSLTHKHYGLVVLEANCFGNLSSSYYYFPLARLIEAATVLCLFLEDAVVVHLPTAELGRPLGPRVFIAGPVLRSGRSWNLQVSFPFLWPHALMLIKTN